jgi:CPA2 family monovalent cation:H+ antiporter-2
MEETRTFGPLLLVVFLAFIVPFLVSRIKTLRIPIVVGEILAGILVGRSFLGWVEGHDPVLDLLAEFGFVFLMFLSGMEIDFSNLGLMSIGSEDSREGNPANNKNNFLGKIWSPVPLGVITFLITLIVSAVIGFVVVNQGLARNPWMLALILSTTSLGVVLPVLKERGLSAGRYGQTLLIASLIADFATMLLITILVAQISHGLTLDILLIGMLFVAFFTIYRLGMFFFNRLSVVRRAMDEITHATGQIKIRAAFTMMLIFVVLSEVLGAEIILGAFLAGAVVSLLRTPEDDELPPQLEAIGFGFFIPIFFIMVGVEFNLMALVNSPESLLLVPLLLIAALLVKLLPALLFKKLYSWRETLGAGFLLSARLSLIIAASAIGLRLQIISEPMNAAIILVAILTVTSAPLLFTRILPEQEEQPRPIIVAGAAELGMDVAESLLSHHEEVILVDPDPDRVARAQKRGLKTFQANLVNPGEALCEYLDRAQSLVCTHTDTEFNFRICEKARSVFGIDHIVAQVTSPRDMPRFESLGIATINAALDRAALMVILTRNPAMYQLLTRTSDEREVTEIVVQNPDCAGRYLRDLRLPGDILVMALRRNGELLVPHGYTLIESGDHLTLVGSYNSMEEIRAVFECN